MSFIQETIFENQSIWEECMKTQFVKELQMGTLVMEKFKRYMMQDSIYLKYYARVFGKAIYHAATLKDIQFYYTALGFVTDKESAVRLNYLQQFGMTDNDIEFVKPLKENQNYINYMMNIAEQGNDVERLMVTLPCMLSYSYIFQKIAAAPETSHEMYWDFIMDYAEEEYGKSCQQWIEFVEEKCKDLSANEQKILRRIFKKASLLELDFWKMVYRDDVWNQNDKEKRRKNEKSIEYSRI